MTATSDVEKDRPVLGVLGGSGVYDLPGFENARWEKVESPFGEPSDELLLGDLDGTALAFLPRHGRGHRIPPSEINYRANIDALKRVGVTDLISVSACGSLREDLGPGTFVVVDQYIDRTTTRASSFFTSGLVAHVSMARPVCVRLGDAVDAAGRDAGDPVVRGGTYLAMEGYASVAMVTDYDCWHEGHGEVVVADIVEVLTRNAARARSLVASLARPVGGRPAVCPEGCDRALDDALITAPGARDPEAIARLDAVAGRVLKGGDA
jgi:5'-methylthioadenosine phosphorylase